MVRLRDSPSKYSPYPLSLMCRYCKSCLEGDATRSITFKAPARKSFRKRTLRDYANLNSGLESDPNRWIRILEGKQISEDPFKRPEGSDVGLEWLEGDEDAMTEPIIIERPEGLGMKMPSDDFTVDDIAELLGEETPVEVIGALGFMCKSGVYTDQAQMLHHNRHRPGGHWGNGTTISTLSQPLAKRYIM